MEEAGREEAEHGVAQRQVGEAEIPEIKVVADVLGLLLQKKHLQETSNLMLIDTCPEMFSKLAFIIHSLELNVRSLIQDVDSNVVEHFNSTVAKFVGGKRINFSLRLWTFCSSSLNYD
ncbi:hypothetical protein ILUMI_18114 [Ignelater luminosus]|uniref:Uncharacterized protein n=1 Tax=Ignelater luminosus TaxID=2038154 RepID=A0A8K0G781_IGNLU|nr:hypothetical protein ILUMI_18114 [Ignelater luminosus]